MIVFQNNQFCVGIYQHSIFTDVYIKTKGIRKISEVVIGAREMREEMRREDEKFLLGKRFKRIFYRYHFARQEEKHVIDRKYERMYFLLKYSKFYLQVDRSNGICVLKDKRRRLSDLEMSSSKQWIGDGDKTVAHLHKVAVNSKDDRLMKHLKSYFI